LYPNLDAARAARTGQAGALLAGEASCLKPEDFDLGNSPREFTGERVKDRAILLATTNGTLAASRAAGGGAEKIFAGSLLNASATAGALLAELDRVPHTLLVCAGTNGT
jgi:2-phosphosulfolactate phosphatase